MSGELSARGGALGGDGGFIEVSAMQNIRLDGTILLSAPSGAVGTFLLDPVNIIIRDTALLPPAAPGEGTANPPVPATGDFTFTANTAGDPTTAVISTALLNASTGNIVLQAGNSITVTSAVNKASGNLTLTAGTTITINASITLTAGNLTLSAASTAAGPVTHAITIDQALTANNINLNAAGSISGAGILTAGTVTVRGATGIAGTSAASLNLSGANEVTTLDARTTDALFFANARAGGLAVTQALSTDRSVTIAANGVITNPNAGGISATNATNGFVLLRPFDTNTAFEVATAAPARGITVAHLGNITSPRLSLQSTGTAALTVTNAFTSTSATLELVGNSIALNATVTGPNNGTVRLFSREPAPGHGDVPGKAGHTTCAQQIAIAHR
jgi:hypothetical protein